MIAVRLFFLFSLAFGPLMFNAQARDDADRTMSTDALLPPCIGYDSVLQRWGAGQTGDARFDEYSCPPHTAVFAVNALDWSVHDYPTFEVPINCCPVPEDLLTNETFLVDEDCGSAAVVTGSHLEQSKRNPMDPTRAILQLICTKINTSRYILAAAAAAVPVTSFPPQLGKGFLVNFRGSATSRGFMRANIPLAIRFGLGRYDRYRWFDEFCAGFPWGSLMSAKHYRSTCPFDFRELMFRSGQANMNPVPIIPECRAISDIFSPNASCRTP